jgi:hypothetical protein
MPNIIVNTMQTYLRILQYQNHSIKLMHGPEHPVRLGLMPDTIFLDLEFIDDSWSSKNRAFSDIIF